MYFVFSIIINYINYKGDSMLLAVTAMALDSFVGLAFLSITKKLTPKRWSWLASMSPVGPAFTISTSTSINGKI